MAFSSLTLAVWRQNMFMCKDYSAMLDSLSFPVSFDQGKEQITEVLRDHVIRVGPRVGFF